MNKFDLVRRVLTKSNPDGKAGLSLLDVGCRTCDLRPYVEDIASYEGLDLYQNSEATVTHVHDLSTGLPFSDRSFDIVVALDVIEHLDDMAFALDELLRVSRRELLIMLPNLAHVHFRLRFLATGRLSGKYDLIYGQGQDRHRWFTTLSQSDAYVQEYARAHGATVEVVWFNDSRKKEMFAKIARALGATPNLWVWAALYVFRRDEAGE